ncbi:MAG: T9SS type A sorting domain-containing protein, partial [Cyclobacteriaceae bacterium]|nr:T9SS type A sorting domain-containing protein [Cyclobacteriaceae bacterium]
GKGYWFNAKEKSDVKIGAGSVVEANQGSSVFQMRLEQGWNQIGNPFPFNIDWSDVMQSNTTAAGKADNIVTVYDPSSTSFKEADNLKVWEGGFVFANEPLTLDLPVTLKNTAGGRKATRQLNSSIDQRDWFVSLTLRQGVAENSYGGIGMHPEARESKDPFDKQTLPRFIKYLELNSYHPEFFSPWFSKDVVPTKESHTWQLEVASNFDEKEIELSWNAPALGNNASKLLLFDPQAGVLLDMKEQSAYRFENTGVRKLKVYYGKDEASLRPDITILGQPYPNPFVGSVNLPFIMGEAGAVQISIFDLLGKKIKDVANNPYNPGLHTVQWDGTDQTGARVAAGVYFYRMMTNGLSPAATGRLIVR